MYVSNPLKATILLSTLATALKCKRQRTSGSSLISLTQEPDARVTTQREN